VTKKAQPIKTIPFDYGLSKYLKPSGTHLALIWHWECGKLQQKELLFITA